MKRSLLTVITAAAVAWSLGSCVVASVIQGSGKEAHGEFDIAMGYTSLSVSGGITVELVLSDVGTGTIVADEKVLQFVSIVENGGRVEVSYDPAVSVNSTVRTVVRLPLSTALGHIDASAAAGVVSGRRIVAQSMEMELSSAARVELDVDSRELHLDLSSASSFEGNVAAGNVMVHLSSASSCELRGTAERLHADANSASDLRALGLVARSAAIDVASASKAEVTATEEITAGAASGATVRYGGNPTIVRQNASTGGSVRNIK